jgi:hypothetical protein
MYRCIMSAVRMFPDKFKDQGSEDSCISGCDSYDGDGYDLVNAKVMTSSMKHGVTENDSSITDNLQ